MDSKEYGAYLKTLRNAKGLTLAQLAKEIGFSNPYISQIENGLKGIPSPELLKELSSPLGVSYEELMIRAGHYTFFDYILNDEDDPDYNKAFDEAYEKVVRELGGIEKLPSKEKKIPRLPTKDLSLLIDYPDITWNGKKISKWNKARIFAMLDVLLAEETDDHE